MIKFHERPLVTFALLAYNQEKYIKAAVLGAFEQDYSPMEIIISDDCSTDSTFTIIKEICTCYKGPHKVSIKQNAKNIGIAGHVNEIFNIACGDLVVLAAGDDISFPTRVSSQAAVFDREKTMLIHSSVLKIDEQGVAIGEWVPPIIEKQISNTNIYLELFGYIGATGACNKKLYLDFGPIVFPKAYEDQVFCGRASLTEKSIIYINQPLVKYRVGSGITTKAQRLDISFGEILRNRQFQIEVYVDIYKQRLLDIEKIAKKYDYAKLKSNLERRLLFYELRLMLYNDKLALVNKIFSKSFQTLSKAFLIECWEIFLQLKKKF